MKKIYILVFLVAFSLVVHAQCDDWLDVEQDSSGVRIGDLDIPGNQVTVEAMFDRTAVYDANFYGGDLVSKHNDPTDVNYLLRPNTAEITTTNGFYITPVVCSVDTGKTYYAALVYDGDSLKFYRNGYLLSAVAASGDLIQNDWITTIGSTAAPTIYPSGFIGYINEVRIWNVARTEDSLRKYINTPLPNPTAQPGLLAYYEFNSLTNLQGNAEWNGTIRRFATVDTINPTCAAFVADSCGILTPLALKGFQGTIVSQSTILSWTTFDEVNTAYNVVERSYDGLNFVALKSLPAKGSSAQNNYQFTDYPSFTNANAFYRLKFMDKDGKYTYSNTLVFPLGKQKAGAVTLFPNPARNYVELTYNSTTYETTTIEVTDISGRPVMSQAVSTTPGTNGVTLNFQNKLQSGTYLIEFVVNGEKMVNKVILK